MVKEGTSQFRSLRSFMKWAEQFNDGQYLFRGVPDKTYKIEASACRRLPDFDRNNPVRLLKINQELIENARLLGHDQLHGKRLSDLSLLAELQHYRAATCLIDFTRNALIALWFACEQLATKVKKDLSNENNLDVEKTDDEKKEVDGKVYAVRVDDPSRYRTVTSELLEENTIGDFFTEDNNSRYPLYQWQPKLQNNRIIAQQSVFIFGGAKIEPADECVIMKVGKQPLLRALDKIIGITDATIYPDSEGFANLNVQSEPDFKPDAQGYLQRGIEAHQKRERSTKAHQKREQNIEEHQKNELMEAISCYTTVISPPPDRNIQSVDKEILFWAHHHRGVAYLDKGPIENALDLAIWDFNKAIELKEEILATSNENLTKVKRLKKDLAKTYVHRGIIHNEKGAFDNAIVDYTKAIDLDPDFADAYYQRGFVSLSKGDLDGAIDSYTKAIDLDPDLTDAYKDLGFAHSGKDDLEKAIIHYTKVLQKDPDDTDTYIHRGLTYFQDDEHEKALDDLGRAIQLNPNDGKAYYNRGTILLELNRWKEAKEDLESAKSSGLEVAKIFQEDFGGIEEFEQNTDITLREDIREILK